MDPTSDHDNRKDSELDHDRTTFISISRQFLHLHCFFHAFSRFLDSFFALADQRGEDRESVTHGRTDGRTDRQTHGRTNIKFWGPCTQKALKGKNDNTSTTAASPLMYLVFIVSFRIQTESSRQIKRKTRCPQLGEGLAPQ